MKSHPRSDPARLLLIPFLAVLLVALLALPARAQTATADAPASPVATSELELLLATLENDQEREAFIEKLRTLVEVQREGEEPREEDAGARLIEQISGTVGGISDELAEAAVELGELPLAALRSVDRLSEPMVRARATEIIGKVALVIIGGLLAEFLLRRLLARPRRRFEEQERDGWLYRLFYLIVAALLQLLPIIAFALVAYGLLPVMEPYAITQLVALALINAILLSRVIILLSGVLLMPEQPKWRLLPLTDETAAYLQSWIRRFAFMGAYGYFLVTAARMLGLAQGAHDLLLALLGLILAAMMVVIILQQRQPVRQFIAGRRAARTTLGRIRVRFAEVWHVLAIAYVIGSFLVWTLDIEGGFRFLLRGTFLTIVVLAAARAINYFTVLLIAQLFSLNRGSGDRPHPEGRVNRYLPMFRYSLNTALAFMLLLLILEIWGLEAFGWLSSGGRVFLSTVFLIGLVLVITVGIWEGFSIYVERTIERRIASGGRSQRLQTLLPLAQNALRIVLVLVVTLIILSEVGVNIAPLLAGAGVVGLAIGFGAQTLVKDIITGIFILIEDSLSVGDVVLVAGHSGVVEKLTVRSMFLRDLEGNVHTLPFSVVDTIQNYSKEFSYALLDIRAPYREDLDRVIGVMQEVADELREDDVYGPNITSEFELLGVDGFDESGALIRARLRTIPLMQWAVKREFNRRIKRAFDHYGIEFPYPHRWQYFGENQQGEAPPLRVMQAQPPPVQEAPEQPEAEPQTEIPSEVPDMPDAEEPPGRPA